MIKEYLNSSRTITDKNNAIFLRLKQLANNKFKIWKIRSKKYLNNSLEIDSSKYKSLITALHQLDDKDFILNEANDIFSGNYRLICGKKIFITKMNWSKDYVNNYEFPLCYIYTQSYKETSEIFDVKNVWEFSRFYHLIVIAKAFALTSDDKYSNFFFENIKDWNEQNPYYYSINWRVNMEVSIRIINFIESIMLINNKDPNIVINNINLINSFIEKHFLYITNNFEKGFNSNNHYLSNLVAVIWCLVLFVKLKSKKKYVSDLQKYIKELIKEIKIQMYNDGWFYEDSIPYHALNTEMIMAVNKMLSLNGLHNSELNSLCLKAYKVLDENIINKQILPLGDLDNGRLLPFKVKEFYEDKLYFGHLSLLTTDIINSKFQIGTWNGYKDFGLFRHFTDYYKMYFKVGKIGVNGVGGHTHNDQLSVLLYVKNKKFFIDPGTGTYNGDLNIRRNLRSNKSHNTVTFMQNEHNNIDGLFKIRKVSEGKLISINNTNICGEVKSKEGYSIKREIYNKENEIRIFDNIQNYNGEFKNGQINFILDPKVTIKIINQKKIILTNLNEKISFYSSNNIKIKENQFYSKSYGEWNYTKKLTIYFEIQNEIIITSEMK